MLIGVLLVLCLASVPLARGRLGALADVRFRAAWLALVAIAGQIVIVSLLPQGNVWLHHAVHLATYGLIAAFLWANRHIAYLWLAALGGALNLAAITANGGVMPADPDALAAAGVHQQAGDFANSDRSRAPAPGLPRRRLRRPGLVAGEQRLQRGRRDPRGGRPAGGALPVRSRLALVRFAAPLAR